MFSKQLIVKAVDFMSTLSHDQLDKEIIYLDLDNRGIRIEGSIQNKKNAVLNYLLKNPDSRDNHGEVILIRMMNNVIEKLLDNVERDKDEFDIDEQAFKSDKSFYRYLRLDGYDIDFDKKCLKEDVSNYMCVSEKDDYIIKFMTEYNFFTSLGHYHQAKGSYLNGNYAALDGQLRTFVESIFQDMATYIKIKEPDNNQIKNISDIDAQQAILIFVKCHNPIIDIDLNEYGENNTGYIQAFWKRLHPKGSHPGLPDNEEALYRFQLVVLNIELIIKRFEKAYPLIKKKYDF